MVRWRLGRIVVAGLVVALATSQVAGASPKLTKEQKKLMEDGKVEKLATSLTKDAKTPAEKISCLYTFVRDEIKPFGFENQRSPTRVLMDGAGREDDKARLLAELLGEIKEECYLATMNFIKYGEQMTYAFVAMKATKKEAEALSKASGGDGKFMRFPIKKKEGKFIPLVPSSGYSIGKLSTEYYEETEEGSGEWEKWKYYVNFSKY